MYASTGTQILRAWEDNKWDLNGRNAFLTDMWNLSET